MDLAIWLIIGILIISGLNNWYKSSEIPGKIDNAKRKVQNIKDKGAQVVGVATGDAIMPFWLLIVILFVVLIIGRGLK